MKANSAFNIIAASVILLTALIGCNVNCTSCRSFNHRAEKQCSAVSTEIPGGCLFTDLTHMDMAVMGQEVSECTVQADLLVSATSQEIADSVAQQLCVKLIQETDRLVLAVQKPQEYKDDYTVSGKMTLTVPAHTSLEMNTTHGQCRFETILSEVKVHSSHGKLDFDNIQGRIYAETTHAGIDLQNTKTDYIQVSTSHGKVQIEDSTIPMIHCSTSHAAVRLDTVSAESLNVRTTHGKIELNHCTANEAVLNTSHGAIRGAIDSIEQLTAQTSHAPINLCCLNETCPDFTAVLNTTHNNIEFSPPACFAGHITASTSHGHIKAEQPILTQGIIDDKISGTIGQGNGKITLISTHGNIILKKPSKKVSGGDLQ